MAFHTFPMAIRTSSTPTAMMMVAMSTHTTTIRAISGMTMERSLSLSSQLSSFKQNHEATPRGSVSTIDHSIRRAFSRFLQAGQKVQYISSCREISSPKVLEAIFLMYQVSESRDAPMAFSHFLKENSRSQLLQSTKRIQYQFSRRVYSDVFLVLFDKIHTIKYMYA